MGIGRVEGDGVVGDKELGGGGRESNGGLDGVGVEESVGAHMEGVKCWFESLLSSLGEGRKAIRRGRELRVKHDSHQIHTRHRPHRLSGSRQDDAYPLHPQTAQPRL